MLAPADTLDLEHCAHRELFEGIDYPWEVLARIEPYLAAQSKAASQLGSARVSPEAHIDPEGVVLEEGCHVEPGAVIQGPAQIGAGTLIRSGAYIRGHALIGRDCVIGNSCEIKNALIFDGCEIPHYNYVGDAVLGHRAHLGAGVILSNVRLDRGEISVLAPDGTRIGTGLEKFSAIVGDFAEIGCNSVLSPGSILGRRSVLYPLTHWQGCLPEDTIVKTRQSHLLVDRE